MALLTEYALTPDVFDVGSYSGEEVCGLYIQSIKEVLLHEGLVRNLGNGEWARLFSGDQRPWHRRAKELLKKLATQKRFVPFPIAGPKMPTNDTEWCDEALHTHRTEPLQGVIVTDATAAPYKSNPVIAPIDRLTTTPWWTSRSQSLRLNRTLADYQTALRLVLRHANSIMFIDPHIDPTQQRYKDFLMLLRAAGHRMPAPKIELHRVCYIGSGASRRFPNLVDLEAEFRRELSAEVTSVGLTVEVFVWDDFHDRYVISDLVGISVPNGFDTTRATNAQTTWTRLGRTDRDDIQREFDPASGRHTVRARFQIS